MRGLYRVVLEPARDTRATRQNSLYWLILSRAAKFLSDGGQRQYTADQMHSAMGRRFLTEIIVDDDGVELERYIRSTTTLNIEQMSQYIDKVQQRFEEKYDVPPLERDDVAGARREGAEVGR